MLVEEVCYARVGLMGNPSDGFEGKTLSFLLNNFSARVTIEHQEEEGIEIVPHPSLDTPHCFASMPSLCQHVREHGYYGVFRLMLATCSSFGRLCMARGMQDRIQRGFRLRYETSIPRMVGLSGSSALIVAAFKGLLRFYNLSLDELGITKAQFPQIILNIEKEDLGISAGLQDRVIQTYGGLVHMDFSKELMSSLGTGRYTELDVKLLPNMYLAYNFRYGSDSGTVHSTVRDRWRNQDPQLVEGMRRLGSLADEAVATLHAHNYAKLALLMEENFAIRRSLYGDEVVGRANIAAIELLRSFGFAAKFCGR